VAAADAAGSSEGGGEGEERAQLEQQAQQAPTPNSKPGAAGAKAPGKRSSKAGAKRPGPGAAAAPAAGSSRRLSITSNVSSETFAALPWQAGAAGVSSPTGLQQQKRKGNATFFFDYDWE
jgi:hypothetical protein